MSNFKCERKSKCQIPKSKILIKKVYLDVNAENDWITKVVLKSLPNIPVERIQDKRALIKQFLSISDPTGTGKRHLFLTRFYGKRLKPCPGTSNHICCGYHVINAMTNCPMDCSYCVLQEYLNNPLITLYTNWEDLLLEIDSFLSGYPETDPRIGTGELSDSLVLDRIFPISEKLILYFAQRQKGILELKTKSTEVDHLLHLNHRERTIISWSLGPQSLIEVEEKNTASLSDRIDAAKRCQEAGYPIGFHFDPLIDEENWKKEYQKTVFTIFDKIDPRRVVWISLGGFRFPPQLKKIAQERFPNTKIFLGELFPGKDGKFRYFKEIRIEMYQKMLRWLREINPDFFVYLCMESQEVWTKVFGWTPENKMHLSNLFEERLKKFLK